MAMYSYYDPNQAAAEAKARRNAALQRLMQMQGAKQKYTNEMNAKLMEQQKAAEDAQKKRTEQESGWWGGGKGYVADALIGGATGALTGWVASGFNPLGAAGGAVAGAGTGLYKGLSEKNEYETYGEFAQPYGGPSPMAMGSVGGQGASHMFAGSADPTSSISAAGPTVSGAAVGAGGAGGKSDGSFSYASQVGAEGGSEMGDEYNDRRRRMSSYYAPEFMFP
jgi:hypothetical protein